MRSTDRKLSGPTKVTTSPVEPQNLETNSLWAFQPLASGQGMYYITHFAGSRSTRKKNTAQSPSELVNCWIRNRKERETPEETNPFSN